MKKFSMMIFILGILIIGCPFNASAQFVTAVREFTGFGGATFGAMEEGTAGAALAVNITPRLGIEGEFGAIFGDDTVFNGSANLVLNLGSGTSVIVPYAVTGAGLLNDGGTDIALNVGGGLKIFVEANMAIRIDFRAFFTSDDGDVDDMERLYGGLIFYF